jgi:hypothetical protein
MKDIINFRANDMLAHLRTKLDCPLTDSYIIGVSSGTFIPVEDNACYSLILGAAHPHFQWESDTDLEETVLYTAIE